MEPVPEATFGIIEDRINFQEFLPVLPCSEILGKLDFSLEGMLDSEKKNYENGIQNSSCIDSQSVALRGT